MCVCVVVYGWLVCLCACDMCVCGRARVVCCTITNQPGPDLTYLDGLGFGVFLVGFFFEVIADAQKTAFRGNPENKDRFITTGRQAGVEWL